MTKPYHLTQEQAGEIACDLARKGINVIRYKDGGLTPDWDKDLASLINAALDKVLGEPVAFIDGKDVILANEGLYLGNDTLLYAPKGLT
jgi:hypothetical protein